METSFAALPAGLRRVRRNPQVKPTASAPLAPPVTTIRVWESRRLVRGITGFGRSATTASRSGAQLIKRIARAIIFAAALPPGLRAQPNQAIDPTVGMERPFGLRGQSCKQYPVLQAV